MVNPEAVKRELLKKIERSLTQALPEDVDKPSTIYRPLEGLDVTKDFPGLSKVYVPKIDTAHQFLCVLAFGFLAT